MIELPDAGNELDVLVAAEIMIYVPSYSLDHHYAWNVVERMQTLGYWVKITGPWRPTLDIPPIGQGDHGFCVGFDHHGTVACGSSWVQAENDSICVAICHAALVTLRINLTTVEQFVQQLGRGTRVTEDLDRIDKIIAEGEEK